MRRNRKKSFMTRDRSAALAKAAAQGRNPLIDALTTILKDSRCTGHWRKYGNKLRTYLSGDSSKIPFVVFSRGNNGKVPFSTFSTVPLFTCPGMGTCSTYCYSLKSWRFPCSLYRQLMLTVLVKEQHSDLTDAFFRLRKNDTLRLYVDGDIDSYRTLKYWFDLLNKRKDVSAYGYSKSWPLFQAYAYTTGEWPTNYQLNLSSGSAYTDPNKLADIPVLRGEFVAVEVPKNLVGKYDDLEYKRTVRKAGKALGYERAFVCPGKCGTCTKKGHACGLPSFKNIPILIGIH
jgi:hypothetical protein